MHATPKYYAYVHLHTQTYTHPTAAVFDAAQVYACLFIHRVQATFLLPTGHLMRRGKGRQTFDNGVSRHLSKDDRRHLWLTAADPDPKSPGWVLG